MLLVIVKTLNVVVGFNDDFIVYIGTKTNNEDNAAENVIYWWI